MRAMIRTLVLLAAIAACTHNPATGPASLAANGNTTAKSAWMEPTHAGYMMNGMPVNYLGWLVRYTDATPGTECTDDLQAVTTIKIITTDVETPTHTRTDLVPGDIPIATQLPDTGITTTIAVVSTTDTTAIFSNGMVTIATNTPKGTKGFDGSDRRRGRRQPRRVRHRLGRRHRAQRRLLRRHVLPLRTHLTAGEAAAIYCARSGSVAQMDRAPGFEPVGRAFESPRTH